MLGNAQEPLFTYRNRTVNISKFGSLARLQEIFNKKCVNFDIGPSPITGVWDKTWQNKFESYLQKITKHGITEAEMQAADCKCITQDLWDQWVGEEIPDVVQRAYWISYSLEGHDFDRVKWISENGIDSYWIMWGPFQMGFGNGNRLGQMLNMLDKEILESCFGNQLNEVYYLMSNKQEIARFKTFQKIKNNLAKKSAIEEGLKCVGESFDGQEAFMQYCFKSDLWIDKSIRKFYDMIPNSKSRCTEIDYAFFMDLSIQLAIDDQKINKCRSSIIALFNKDNDPKPSEIRKVIGDAILGSMNKSKNDRSGRNAIYYYNTLKSKMTKQEINDWTLRSNFIAEDFGLSDLRKFYPFELK